MEVAKLVLEFLKIVLSPQVVAGVVALVFFWKFRDNLRALIDRIARIRFPGGEVSTSQAERATEVHPDSEAKLPIPPDEKVPLPATWNLTPEQVKQLRELFQAERANAYLWEYRYLNYFLVPHTQIVLDWLASSKDRPTSSLYDTIWSPAIPKAEERRAVIDALESHHLVSLQGALIEVTPKGREYNQWRGPLSRLAT